MNLTHEVVLKVARLAHLWITEEESAKYAVRLQSVFSWIDQLHEVSVDEVEPLINPLEAMGAQGMHGRDDVAQSCKINVVMHAPKSEQGFFLVPKVVE